MPSYLMFLVENICTRSWNTIIDKAMDYDYSSTSTRYIIMSKKKKVAQLIGFVQFEPINHCNIYKDLENIMNNNSVKFWKECNQFRELCVLPMLLYNMVKHDSELMFEHHIDKYPEWYDKKYDIPQVHKLDIYELCNSNYTNSCMILIVEERMNNLPEEFRKSCLVKVNNTMLSLYTRKQLKRIHIIHPATMQCYHSFGFHHNPHYGIRQNLLQCFLLILNLNEVDYIEYADSNQYHSNDFITIHNNSNGYKFCSEELYNVLKTYKLKSRNISNYFISYGFSAEHRSVTGEPLLTTGIFNHKKDSQQLLPLVLPILSRLTKSILLSYPLLAPSEKRRLMYAQRMGSNFNFHLNDINIFEGFDVSIVHGQNIIQPHCDVMNDWRKGYDFISVLKSSLYDADLEDTVTISIICYTRKAVGDRLCSLSKKNTK